MILLVYYHWVIRATWNCQLSHKRGITFSILNDSIDKCRFCLLTIHHIVSGLTTGETAWERETNKPANTQTLDVSWALGLATERGEGERGPGGIAWSSRQVTHTECATANSVYKETSVPLLRCIVANYILAHLWNDSHLFSNEPWNLYMFNVGSGE